jgi:competence protein ComGF
MEKGFTLIEILIYTFLLALTISLIVGIMTNFLFFRGIFLTREEVVRSIPYFLEDITKEIRGADEIIYPEENKSSSELLLKEEGQNLSFKLKEGIIIKEVEDKTFSLTPKVLNIKSLKFLHLKQSPDAPSSVKIKLEVEYKNPLNLRGYEFFASYQTSATQRRW